MTPPPSAPPAAAASVPRAELGLALGLAALVFGLFHFLGNNANVAMEGRSLFVWIWHYWTRAGDDMAHAWMMPLISAGIIWVQRRDLWAAEKRVSITGLAVLLAGLLMHLAAIRAQQPRLSLIALTVVLWALPFYLYGGAVARRLLFPCAYLLLSFTSYFLVAMTFRLRLLGSVAATWLLNGLGVDAHRVGSAIFTNAGGGFNFDVADACSGLRSLVVMTAIAAPYAYFLNTTALRKWLLFVLSVPLALAANVLRIISVALIAHVFGQDTAMRIYHDYSGYLVFVLSVLLLMGAANLLTRDWRKGLQQWIAPDAKPI